MVSVLVLIPPKRPSVLTLRAFGVEDDQEGFRTFDVRPQVHFARSPRGVIKVPVFTSAMQSFCDRDR